MKIEAIINQKKFESPLQKAVINIMYTYNWLMELQEKIFADHDLSPQQYNVLRILRGRYPNSICVGDIKEVMLDKNPDLTRLCDRLLAKKLIERKYNELNRRQVLVSISKKGLELLKVIDPKMKKYTKRLKLSNAEAETLSGLLDKMRG